MNDIKEKNAPYVVYILECSDGTFYTGITTDLGRRFAEHKDGVGSRYTRAHGVRKVVYVERCVDRSDASKREAAIKSLSRKEKEALIASTPLIL